MGTQILTVMGAAGGVGTTRLTVECGAMLARTGRDVAIFDAAFETQGLASYVSGEIAPDLTTLLTDGGAIESALYDHDAGTDGRFAFCPVDAPFERLCRAKTAGAAREFESQLAAASLSFDVVLVDTPPLGTNPALSAVNSATRLGLVTTDSHRGADALARTRERLSDVGATADVVLTNGGETDLIETDAVVPETDRTRPGACPVCLDTDGSFTAGIADAAGGLLGTELDVEITDQKQTGGLL